MTTPLILSVNEVAISLSLHSKLNVVVHAVQIVQTPSGAVHSLCCWFAYMDDTFVIFHHGL